MYEVPAAVEVAWKDGRWRKQQMTVPISRQVLPGAPVVQVQVDVPSDPQPGTSAPGVVGGERTAGALHGRPAREADCLRPISTHCRGCCSLRPRPQRRAWYASRRCCHRGLACHGVLGLPARRSSGLARTAAQWTSAGSRPPARGCERPTRAPLPGPRACSTGRR